MHILHVAARADAFRFRTRAGAAAHALAGLGARGFAWTSYSGGGRRRSMRAAAINNVCVVFSSGRRPGSRL
eukprot:9638039-Alexandrium_andersonii.AAC.1